MAIARLNGEVIAESSETVILEGHQYFPAQSVRVELFRPTSVRDDRPYYSVMVRGRSTPDCACYVTGPAVPDPRIAEHVEFFGPVVVED
ncbi:MAG TPA: DUF427 domain-containing protein [Pseudonocardiaceae bacterium]|jgi:uncharacterized protein (DUF427 family)|nr:DUF427 domain-containing protein [Pseudonocardiaceae bacterium]